jgi:hypothetical protein
VSFGSLAFVGRSNKRLNDSERNHPPHGSNLQTVTLKLVTDA